MRRGLIIAGIGVAAVVSAVVLFPRAFPVIALDNQLTAPTALAKADSFLAAHALAPEATRRAVQFHGEDSLLTYVDLEAGGADSANAIVRGRDAALYVWAVRAFEPGQVHEAQVQFAPDGRVVGFRRKLAEADARPDVGADSAQALARGVLAGWMGEDLGRWRLETSSYETRKGSERVDRTFTFERTDRKIGEAPLRMDVVVGGDLPIEARPYVEVPETFSRRYGEMRSANDLLALLATLGIFSLAFLGFWALRTHSRGAGVRWKPALVVGSVTAGLVMAAGANSAGAGWFVYDTAMPPALFQAIVLGSIVAGGVLAGAMMTLTLAAAESATRAAFPQALDWWKLWRYRGTREVAGQVAGGYVVGAIALAYVAAFYVVTRGLFGWWTPSTLMDDPNQMATPAPWIAGIALSFQAGVWEEALFRALPLGLLSVWVGNRPNRGWWMAGGVVATALVFGFAHANYPSWPAYARGVEIFIDACFWGWLFLRFGFLVTVLAHYAYDLVLFSLFAATGSAPEYRIATAIAALALFAPAIAVAWKALRQGGLTDTPDDARFGAWSQPVAAETAAVASAPVAAAPMSARSRQIAIAVAAATVVLAVGKPSKPVRGPAFTADRDRAVAVADSMVSAIGVTPSEFRRLTTTAQDTLTGWSRFLQQNEADSLALELAGTYAVPAWWTVRFVRTEGTLAERAEEWRVRVYPDGRPYDVRHIVADSAPGASPPADSVRRIARFALASAGIDTGRLREANYDETPRPNRRDVAITWTDTSVALPDGAAARAWVTLAGNEVLAVRRGVELPETFLRSERERSTRLIAYTALFASLLIGALVGAIVFVARKRAAVVTERVFDRSTFRLVVTAVTASVLAGMLNGWPDAVFSYDTSSTWSNHVIGTGAMAALSVIAALMLVGLWLLLEMLRVRTGVAAWPPEGAPGARRDALLAGVGLGAVFALRGLLPGAAVGVVAAAPSSALNVLYPALVGVVGAPVEVVVRVVAVAIPVLTIMALSPVRRTRWLLVALFIALGAGAAAPSAMDDYAGGVSAFRAALALAAAIGMVSALRWWGARGAFTWLVAAAVSVGIDGVRDALYDASAPERVSGALAVAGAIAVVWWLNRQAARTRTPPAPA